MNDRFERMRTLASSDVRRIWRYTFARTTSRDRLVHLIAGLELQHRRMSNRAGEPMQEGS